jgi:Tfp pilus assembly protein PilO
MNTQTLLRKGWHIDALGAAACLVLTLGVYLLGVGPLRTAHQDFTADQEALATELAHADRLEASLQTLQAQLLTTRRRAAETTLDLAPLGTAPTHLARISQLATAAGLQVDDIQTGNPVPGAYATAVPVTLSGSGTYTACTRFLAGLRQALPETCVQTFALTGEAKQATGSAAFRVDLRWHATLRASPPEPAGPTQTSAAGESHGAERS